MSTFDDLLAEAASLLERGDLDGAQRLLKESPSPRSEPENHRLGALCTNLGLAQINAGSIAAARENLTKALTHLRLAQAEDPSAVALAYGNLGLLEREVGDLEAAQRHYEHSLAVFEELGDRANRGWALLNLGLVKKDQNMLTLARIDLEEALSLLTRQEDLRNRGHAALGLGMVFERLNQPNEAIAHYHMALEAYRGAKDEDSEAVTLQNLGVLYSELGQFEEALDYYRRAEEIYEDCGDAVGRAEILSARASVLQVRHPPDLETAKDLHRKALSLYKETGYLRGQISALTDLGIIARDQHEFEEAERRLNEAVATALRYKDPHELYESYFIRGELHHIANQVAQAIRDYQAAAEVAESVRGRLLFEEEALGYFSRPRLEAYERLVYLYAEALGRTGEAFDWAERAKSREMLRQMRLTDFPSSSPRTVPEPLIHREARLLTRLQEATSTLAATESPDHARALEDYEATQEALNEVWTQMEEYDPEYVFLRRGQPYSWSSIRDSLQDAAGRRVLLVEYFTFGQETFVFGLRADLKAPKLAKVDLDQDELRSFVLTHFGEHNRVRDLIEWGFEEQWHASYDRLVEPLASWAQPERDVVCLVPHGLLHYLPLHALKLEGQYLIKRNPVAYCPSASVLRYSQNKRKTDADGLPARRTAAVFGDSRSDLADARAEAETVARLFGIGPILGAEVTSARFRETVAGADVVHFAGHGDFRPGGLESGLRMAGEQVLTAREVLDLEGLYAYLVALSGCETGINENRPGDELIGLSRAFLYAGTPSVLVSLWRVAEDSTRFLMKRFYTYLREDRNVSKAEALRWAMLDTKSDRPQWGSFYNWAPFVLVGDWQ